MRIVVTGAAGGIGRAVAELAARQKAEIGLVDRDQDALREVADELSALGAGCVPVQADLATVDEPVAAVHELERALGGIDVLCSNAGFSGGGPLKDLSIVDYDRAFAVNTRATWLLARTAYPALVRSKGSVVVTTSISARHPTPRAGAYSASKAALSMLVQHLALEWGPDGIRVNAVAPGPVDTPMTFGSFGDPADRQARERRRYRENLAPLRKLGAARQVAEAILFLAGPAATHITGAELVVDGGAGLTTMPGSHPPSQGQAAVGDE